MIMTTEFASKLFIAFMISTVTMYISMRANKENGLAWGLIFTFLFLHVSHMFW